MQFSKYEETFTNVSEVKRSAAKYADQVASIVRNAKDGITCKEIGKAIWGDEYLDGWMARSYASQLGQVLSNLAYGHFVKFEKVNNGDPIPCESSEWVWDEPENPVNEPRKLHVRDDYGREFWMDNPNYYRQPMRRGHYQQVTKYIQPKVKVWHWIDK